MKNYFCDNCNQLTTEAVCPKCGKPTREPKQDDMCFVCELSGIDADMFADALSNNEVNFVRVPNFSVNAIDAPKLQGVNWDGKPSSYKFYVHFADYDQATETLDVLFGGDSADNEPVDDRDLIDRIVTVTIDRPQGSIPPKHPNIKYELNYGYVKDVIGGDGEEQDAYVLDWNIPTYIGQEINGYIVAVIRRKNDVETKWVVATNYAKKYTREQIAQAVNFQEKFFDIEIIM